MTTFQLRLLKASDYLMTFTENSLKRALKRMFEIESEKHEDIALYGLHNGEWLKLTDTSIYRSKDEKNKISNYSTVFL